MYENKCAIKCEICFVNQITLDDAAEQIRDSAKFII